MKLFRFFLIFLGLSLNTQLLADEYNLNDTIGSYSLHLFKDEMVGTFLIPFCRHDIKDKKTSGVSEIFQCLESNGRPLKTDAHGSLLEKEIMLALPGSTLRNGFFSRFEKEALGSIDLENELAKTPTGRQLLSLYHESSKSQEIRIKLFYHLERATNIYSNTLTRERLERQPHEHFGFTVSKDGKAIVGVNAYQNSNEAFYTLVHELFHLFDPEIKEKPNAAELVRQEIRALLFELRIYLERKQLAPNDRYSDSQFHENFIIRQVNGTATIDWAKLGYYVDTRFFPSPEKNKFVFSAKSTDFLNYGSSNEIESLDAGLLFNEVLLKLFEKELAKPKNDQDQDTIVGRLRYALSDSYNEKKASAKAASIKQMYVGFASMFSQDYGYLINLDKDLSLRTNGINNIITGGPRPRDSGGP